VSNTRLVATALAAAILVCGSNDDPSQGEATNGGEDNEVVAGGPSDVRVVDGVVETETVAWRWPPWRWVAEPPAPESDRALALR
jgi:hypothetical protein